MAQHKYLVLFRREPGERPAAAKPPSPEEMQKMFAAYGEWMKKFEDRILDPGAKLKSDGKMVSASGVADGPYVEAKELIGGYMILSAESYEGAVEVMKACPAIQEPGGFMEIRELAGGM